MEIPAMFNDSSSSFYDRLRNQDQLPPAVVDLNLDSFVTALRAPIFHARHANIDRLWNIWVDKLGGKVFSDPDWLDSSVMFYNEEAKPVIVKVKDCLESTSLRYVYEDINIPWLDARRSRRGVADRRNTE
ncbi:UNVERIFIED_CONTAM: Polyphenol oxidase, chloroplastic [Sesamum calycinum]|uniref:Polyphenol oxidase, chloroplastic n=1 Tax=Sesamum calycinum TaxID=2727403 RepID=A0AAW2LRE3_9LAMI